MAIPDSYPEAVRTALQRMLDGFAAAEPAPVAVVVYGSLAKGTYRAGSSDVNLVVVLDEASDDTLTAIRDTLRAAWRAVRMRPFLVTRAEIPRLADAFPIKIADIVDHHDVLHGDDPFTGVTVERDHMRLRIEQELRNHLLRLRRHYVFAGDEDGELAKALFGSASSLGIEVTALLRVCGKSEGQGTLESVAEPAARHLDLDRTVFDRLIGFRKGEKQADIHGLFFAVVTLLEKAVKIADELEVAS